MTLDAPKSDAQLLRELAEKTGTAVKGISTASPRGTRAHPDNPLTEHAIQVALFEKVNDPAEQLKRPALALVHAVPNGASASSFKAALRRKAEGQKPGVPDIDCPVARGGYHGLRIEMKKPGGTTTTEQAHWMATLAREGYKVALHTTVDGAWAELLNYLDSPRTFVIPAGPSPPQHGAPDGRQEREGTTERQRDPLR